MWNAPWLASINGLLAPYDGSFTVHSEYPMFIPSLVVKDLNLRLKFEENGLDYHDIDDGRSSDDGESEEEKEILPAVPSHQRQSLRLPIIKKIAVQREEEDKKKRKAELRKERAQLRLDQSKADKEGKKLSHGMSCTLTGFRISRRGFLCRKLLLRECGFYTRPWS